MNNTIKKFQILTQELPIMFDVDNFDGIVNALELYVGDKDNTINFDETNYINITLIPNINSFKIKLSVLTKDDIDDFHEYEYEDVPLDHLHLFKNQINELFDDFIDEEYLRINKNRIKLEKIKLSEQILGN